ncbi:MAG: low molecular weight protein-tyrosine-phosphatase [Propionicimonas sp.]
MTSPVIEFVCWGNLCRSPMAERVAQAWAKRDHITGVTFTSAGVSNEGAGKPIDERAAEVLRAAGYRADGHSAHKITPDEIRSASMLIGMEQLHLDRIKQMVPGVHHLYLLSNFDRNAVPGSGIPDPWYGTAEGFNETLTAIEAAMPEVMRRARELIRR